jgi:2-phosphosulfolactate phosphatase
MEQNKPGIEVCLSPDLIYQHELQNKTVVVVDVLRATSTMCSALFHGVDSIIPVAGIDDCLSFRGKENHILAAERDAKTPEGFDYSNSPLLYHDEKVVGKTLVLSTTNGTKILSLVKGDASQVVIGAFVNIDAIASYLLERNQNIIIACAAWKGRPNMEDSLFAGGLAYRLKEHFNLLDDSCRMMSDLYSNINKDLYTYHTKANHFNRLKALGALADFEYCFKENAAPVVPVLRGIYLVKA